MATPDTGPRQFFFGPGAPPVSEEDAAREAGEDADEDPTPVRSVKPSPRAAIRPPPAETLEEDIVERAKKRLEKIDLALVGMKALERERAKLARLIAAADADDEEQLDS